MSVVGVKDMALWFLGQECDSKLLLVTALVELTHHPRNLSGAWISPEKNKSY